MGKFIVALDSVVMSYRDIPYVALTRIHPVYGYIWRVCAAPGFDIKGRTIFLLFLYAYPVLQKPVHGTESEWRVSRLVRVGLLAIQPVSYSHLLTVYKAYLYATIHIIYLCI